MTDHEYVEANDYGVGEFGGGAFGDDYNPETTENHEWSRPSRGEENWHETFDTLFDEIDTAVAEFGDVVERPTAADDARIWIDPSGVNMAQVTIAVEIDGEWIIPELPFDLESTTITLVDEEVVLTSRWTFEEPLVADILGNAVRASVAEYTPLATTANNLGGDSADLYISTAHVEQITASWTYEADVHFRGGMDFTDAQTFDLPVYD